MNLNLIKEHKCFGGMVEFYSHFSQSTQTDMKFCVFTPAHEGHKKLPVLFWLSGLTCTEENFITKAQALQFAAKKGVVLVCPDTSPRGANIPGENESWDLGLGAGFYVNATQSPWSEHYHMYDYVVEELPRIIDDHFHISPQRMGIFGHSMGGHGALVIGLKNPDKFKSISAFAPICSPSNCPWGEKAFGSYLGDDKAAWKSYDACELLLAYHDRADKTPLLVDQGTLDNFLDEQLKPHLLEEAAQKVSWPLELRRQKNYDHSYFFISTFIGDHLQFHCDNLYV